MKKYILALAGLGIVFGAMAANADPEADRMKMINYLEHKYPEVKPADYIYGALAYDPDAKSQYDSIMEFPPFHRCGRQGREDVEDALQERQDLR